MIRRRGPLSALVVASTGLLVASCGGEPERANAPTAGVATPGGLHAGLSWATPEERATPSAEASIYVPVYPFVHTEDNARPYNLAATLYVRNTDPSRPIFLDSVRYHDASGKLVRDFLKATVRIGPLASMEFFVKESDVSAGSSASFVVGWSATEPVSEPVVESVMIGVVMNQGIAFTSPGRTIGPRRPR